MLFDVAVRKFELKGLKHRNCMRPLEYDIVGVPVAYQYEVIPHVIQLTLGLQQNASSTVHKV